MDAQHTPVMVEEVLDGMAVRSSGAYIDCTVGAGGHSLAILGAAPNVRLLGIDLDAEALEAARRRLAVHGDRVRLAQGNFAEVGAIAERHGFESADGVLMDLGLSSMQVDSETRGFSFRRRAGLDMRFDPASGRSAHHVVNESTEEELASIMRLYGEERRARRVAREIVKARPIGTTTQLAALAARVAGPVRRGRIHPATRVFQAIRMHVNNEIGNLGDGLVQAIQALASGGRMAVISYHSVEDRVVKETFRREASDCICPPEIPECVCDHKPTITRVNRRVIKPSPQEVHANPRSRSARLRVAERIPAPAHG